MTDAEIRDNLRALDNDDDVTLTSWECSFIDSILWGRWEPPSKPEPATFALSEKQRVVAMALIEKTTATQQTTRRLPPGAEKYFRRDA